MLYQKASLPHPFQPGRPIRSAASHTDGQPRLQSSGARLTSLKKEDARRLARSLEIAGGPRRRAGWLHFGGPSCGLPRKVASEHEPHHHHHTFQAYGMTGKDKPPVAHARRLSTRAAAHPLDKCRSCCIRFGSAPFSLGTCAFFRLASSLPHRLTADGVDGHLSIGRCRMKWCDPPAGAHPRGRTDNKMLHEGVRSKISRLVDRHLSGGTRNPEVGSPDSSDE